MKTTHHAGVREAKSHLSKLLRDVQLGHEYIITERGKPIARLVPVEAKLAPLEERLRRLEDAGVIESRPAVLRGLPPPLPLEDGLAQRLLQSDRDA
jgi:prevent-host-death family protein